MGADFGHRFFLSICAQKAQIAVDEDMAVNFQDLQYFDRPEFVAAFRKEQQLLKEVRAEVLGAPKGQYNMPKAVKDYKQPMVRIRTTATFPRC